MNVIFLDVDGVLNDHTTKAREPCGCIGIDDKKVSVLQTIARLTDAKIVLTSTWKDGWEEDPDLSSATAIYLMNKLKRQGLRIIDKTDYTSERGKGIREWLARHPATIGWVVLDDDIFPDYQKCEILPHLVKTSFFEGGLKKEHINPCVEIVKQTGGDALYGRDNAV